MCDRSHECCTTRALDCESKSLSRAWGAQVQERLGECWAESGEEPLEGPFFRFKYVNKVIRAMNELNLD